MARPLSDDKRKAILAEAVRIVATEGVGAQTARIAKGAGVAEGTLFTYFNTKDALLNHMYAALKREVTGHILRDFPDTGDLRRQLGHVWRTYIAWGVNEPERHRALQQLSLSDRVTAETRALANDPLSSVADLFTRCVSQSGSMPVHYAVASMGAFANATIDEIVSHPDDREALVVAGEAGLWRFLGAA